mgnify:CR=1 FL=1
MRLISQRGFLVTPDTSEALRELELQAARVPGLKLKIKGVPNYLCSWGGVSQNPGPTGLPPEISMRPTGREIYIEAEIEGQPADPSVVWSLAVPLGFMPWDRYPVSSPTQSVLHYMGPWASLVDFLHGEGRGEAAWPSLCAAAQSDAGKWEGGRDTEISLQANLHRLGIHCGPVDGILGEKTVLAISSLGFQGKPVQEIVSEISVWENPTPNPGEASYGTFAMPGKKVNGFSSGGVRLIKTQSGFSVTAESPGKVTFVVGD